MIKLKSLSKKAGFLAAIAGAAVIGGATTAIVTAAIPSTTDDKLYGCYRNAASFTDAKGALRLIDNQATPAQTCTAQETAVNWPATASAASQEAYTYIARDLAVETIDNPSAFYLDPTRTKNVTSMVYAPLQFSDGETTILGGYCVTLPFTPKNIQATPEDENFGASDTVKIVGVKDDTGIWSLPTTGNKYDPTLICQNAPTANAVIALDGGAAAPGPYFLKFEN